MYNFVLSCIADIDGIDGGNDVVEGGCFVLDVGDRVLALKRYCTVDRRSSKSRPKLVLRSI